MHFMKTETTEELSTSLLPLAVKTIKTTEPLAGQIMQKTKDAMGFIPNMYRLMANNPALLDAYTYSYHSFRKNAGFTPIEQEVVFLSVAYENKCSYCMGAHSFVADKMSKVPAHVTNAIREGKEISDHKLNALSLFSRAITRSRGKVTKEELDSFLNAGYNKEQVLGVIAGVGIKTFSNYFNHIAHTPLDEIFSTRKWSK